MEGISVRRWEGLSSGEVGALGQSGGCSFFPKKSRLGKGHGYCNNQEEGDSRDGRIE